MTGHPLEKTVSARISRDTFLKLRFIGFDFSVRIREYLEGELLLFEIGEYRTDQERITSKRKTSDISNYKL